MSDSTDLASRKCVACDGGVPPLKQDEVSRLLKLIRGWESADGRIAKTYSFKNYHETMAFVNAAAWISHREDHHPDMTVGYSKCRVEYTTHAIGGLSENDFICAAKLDALFRL
jgi:4a-hydroxytetrahydrobiopterin dehydratase